MMPILWIDGLRKAGLKEQTLTNLTRFLCFLGLHRFRVVEKAASFGSGGVEKVRCERCGLTIRRQG
jgi:hypothetical protein